MGSLDMWVGEWRAVCPGVTRGGSSFGGHLSGAGGPGVVSSRLLFEEGKGCGSLSPPGVESDQSELWKRGLGQNNAYCDNSRSLRPPTVHQALCQPRL